MAFQPKTRRNAGLSVLGVIMIFNKYKTKSGRIKDLRPNPTQNKYLLTLTCESRGRNYNGYGYRDTVRTYSLTPYQLRKYKELGENYQPPKNLSEAEKIARWANRLSKLADVDIEKAHVIALEKIDYKQTQIEELEERQADLRYSEKRQSLINKLIRSNPLGPIKDVDHAYAIMSASHRHNETDYDFRLGAKNEYKRMGYHQELAEELARIGE